jgi:plasmid stabilization system protein ParE
MKLIWAPPARADLIRLHRFLAPKSRAAAAKATRTLRDGAEKLVDYPRLGERIEELAPREFRRLFVADYELRYEIRGEIIAILRIWHTREER